MSPTNKQVPPFVYTYLTQRSPKTATNPRYEMVYRDLYTVLMSQLDKHHWFLYSAYSFKSEPEFTQWKGLKSRYQNPLLDPIKRNLIITNPESEEAKKAQQEHETWKRGVDIKKCSDFILFSMPHFQVIHCLCPLPEDYVYS